MFLRLILLPKRFSCNTITFEQNCRILLSYGNPYEKIEQTKSGDQIEKQMKEISDFRNQY